MACHGVARQGEDGRTHLVRQVRQVRQVRHKRHAHAPRIPPQPSKKTHLFNRQKSFGGPDSVTGGGNDTA